MERCNNDKNTCALGPSLDLVPLTLIFLSSQAHNNFFFVFAILVLRERVPPGNLRICRYMLEGFSRVVDGLRQSFTEIEPHSVLNQQAMTLVKRFMLILHYITSS